VVKKEFRMDKDVQPLSPEAKRLLDYMRLWANERALARTDAAIAAMLSVPVRDVIDLRRELIAHQHMVVAEVTSPMGSWLCLPQGDLPAVKNHALSLRHRGVEILKRARDLLRGHAAAEAKRRTESTGQQRLFT